MLPLPRMSSTDPPEDGPGLHQPGLQVGAELPAPLLPALTLLVTQSSSFQLPDSQLSLWLAARRRCLPPPSLTSTSARPTLAPGPVACLLLSGLF